MIEEGLTTHNNAKREKLSRDNYEKKSKKYLSCKLTLLYQGELYHFSNRVRQPKLTNLLTPKQTDTFERIRIVDKNRQG